MNDNAESFWHRVKELIKSQKTTQEWVANSAEISLNSFKQQIFHNRMPTADEAVLIAKALNTTVEYLVTGKFNDTEKELNDLKHKVMDFAKSVQ